MTPKRTKKQNLVSDRAFQQKALNLAPHCGNWTELADALGVHRNTVQYWLAQGGAGVEPYASFVAELQREIADDSVKLRQSVRAAADDDWKAAVALLEHRERTRRDIVQGAYADMTDEEAAEAMAKLPIVRAAVLRQLAEEKAQLEEGIE